MVKKLPPTFKETPLGLENLLWKLSTHVSPSCQMKKREEEMLSLKKVMTIFDLLQITYGLEHAIYPWTFCGTDFTQQNTYRNTLKWLSYTDTRRDIWLNYTMSWDGRTAEMVLCCLLVHTILSSVILPATNGLGAEEHQFHTVQVKNTLCQWHFTSHHGNSANCFQIKAMMCVHFSDCNEQNTTSSSNTVFCLHQGRVNKKKRKNILALRKYWNKLNIIL